jgi:nitric oxide reductase subunit B
MSEILTLSRARNESEREVLTFAGTIQTHMQGVIGDYYLPVQDSLSIFYLMRFGSGLAVVAGALLFIYSMLVVRTRQVIAPGAARSCLGSRA